MKPFLIFFIISLLQSLSFSTSNASLEETCKKVSKVNPNSNYAFCVASLQADPNSHAAGTKALASIAINITRSEFQRNWFKAKDIRWRRNETAPSPIEAALYNCMDVYDLGSLALQEAGTALESGDLSLVDFRLGAALTDVDRCIDVLNEKGVGSLLRDENDGARSLAVLAIDIVSLLR